MNLDVDGVSVYAHFSRIEFCTFLEGKTHHFSTNDPNHNSKILHYQLIGGSFLLFSGIHIIDSQTLQAAEASKDLWRTRDFAYYLLVLKLASSDTVNKLVDLI